MVDVSYFSIFTPLSSYFLGLNADVSYFSIFTPLSSYFLGLNALLTPQVSQLCDFDLFFYMYNMQALKNNGSMRTQLPNFVKLKSLKVVSYPWICDDRVREMVTYLLQNSPPPATFVISQDADLTYDGCVFIGFLIKRET
jgi:hypothetical protein